MIQEFSIPWVPNYGRMQFPEYTPCSKEWTPRAALPSSSSIPAEPALGGGPEWAACDTAQHEVICFGPGVQLEAHSEAETASPQAPPQGLMGDGPEQEAIDDDVTTRAFIKLPPPVVPATPAPERSAKFPQPPATAPAMRAKSARQAAKKSSIPVSKRAQLRLVKELRFVEPDKPGSDKALQDYIDMYKQPLPQKAIEALRKATRLGSKPMA